MRPEYRRCALYVLVALAGLPFVARRVNDLRPPDRRPDLRVMCVADAVFALGALSILRWRLRVDECGIARRRLVRWNRYAWDEFASGRVREGDEPDSFRFAGRAPWNRTLSLGLLRDDDRAAVRSLIHRVWVRPTGAEFPADLGLRYAFGKRASFARECLTIAQRGEDRRYAWGEVRALKVRRFDRSRRDFTSLVLELPDRTVTLRVNRTDAGATPSWQGLPGRPRPDAATVAAALLTYVPTDRVVVTSLSEPPATWAEWEDRRSVLEVRSKEIRTLWRVMAVFGAVSLAHCLYVASVGRGSGVVMLTLYLVIFGVVWLVVRSLTADHVRALRDLETVVPGGVATVANRQPGGTR